MVTVTFKGSPVHLKGKIPTIGTQLPNFKLVNSDLQEKNLHDYKGKKKVLYIVPSLDTSVCLESTRKMNQFAKSHHQVSLLVISADLPFAQKRICGLEHLENVQTLSMLRNKDFAEAYGLLIEDGPLAGLCARCLIITDEHDKILHIEVVKEITEEPNYHKLNDYFSHH